MKKIIFFDGDGTLWYPKLTKYTKAPWWVYTAAETAKNPNRHLVLTPTTLSTLKRLRARGIILVVLSTHPHPPEEADVMLKKKVRHFDLHELFDEIHAARPYHESKGEIMAKILKRRKIPKSQALMIGDKYDWDYRPARKNGIEALLVTSDYEKNHAKWKICRKIKRTKDIFRYI